MLKNCILPTNYENNMRCGEIICSANTNFIIICVFCKIKLFDFEDFLQHYKNVHVDKVNTLPLKQEKSPESCQEFDFLADSFADVSVLPNSNQLEQSEYIKNESECASLAGGSDSSWPMEDENAESDGTEYSTRVEPILKKPRVPKDFQCSQCSKRYTTAKNRQMHENLVHFKSKDYKCDQCSAEFTEERYLNAHTKKMHTEFPCSQCGKVYKNVRSLKYHENSHKEAPDYLCDFENCNKAFRCKKNLTSHMRMHTQERNIVCEICGYRTRFRKNLEDHIRTHTGERPFICKTCGKGFATKSMLIEHQPIHSSERPHKCEVCGAAFSRAKALYHHKHLHLGVKKFVCKICDRAYAQAAGLAGHMRQHKAEMNTMY